MSVPTHVTMKSSSKEIAAIGALDSPTSNQNSGNPVLRPWQSCLGISGRRVPFFAARLTSLAGKSGRPQPTEVDEKLETASTAASPAVFWLAAIGVAASTGLFVVLYSFFASTYPKKITAIREIHLLFGSQDVQAQNDALLISLIFLAIFYIAIFFAGAKIIVESVSVAARTMASKISAAAAHSQSILFVSTLIMLACVPSLFHIVWSISQKDVFLPDEVRLLFWADPHINSVFGLTGESILGNVRLEKMQINAYGIGAPLAYASARWLGMPAEYKTAFDVARAANIMLTIMLVASLLRFWRGEKSQFWRAAITFVAIVTTITPLLLINGPNVLFGNLSGIRFMPIGVCVLIGCFWHPPKTLTSYATYAFIAAASVALVPDAGLVGALGLAVIVALDGTGRWSVVGRGAGFLASAVGFYVAICLATKSLTSIKLYEVWFDIADPAVRGFGGTRIEWRTGIFAIVALTIFSSCLLINKVGENKPQGRERVALSACIMILLLLPYYMHRPSDYYIFWLLALFPLSYLIQQAMGPMSASAASLAKLGLAGLSLAIVSASNPFPSFDQVVKPKPDTVRMTRWSGLTIPVDVANSIQGRLDALTTLGTKDAVVVTGIPYAVSASGAVSKPPIGALFELGQRQRTAALIRKLLRKRPSTVVLEAADTPALGPAAIAAIVAHIESKIAIAYTRDLSITEWRVWRLTKPKELR